MGSHHQGHPETTVAQDAKVAEEAGPARSAVPEELPAVVAGLGQVAEPAGEQVADSQELAVDIREQVAAPAGEQVVPVVGQAGLAAGAGLARSRFGTHLLALAFPFRRALGLPD